MDRVTANIIAHINDPPSSVFTARQWKEKTGWPPGMRPEGR